MSNIRLINYILNRRKYNCTEKQAVKMALVVSLLASWPLLQTLVKPQQAVAAFNEELNYQGKLTDQNYDAVTDGEYQMQFKIYDAVTGGATLYDELWTDANTCNTGMGTPTGGTTTTVPYNETAGNCGTHGTESSWAVGQIVCNLTEKNCTEITAVDTSGNTITVAGDVTASPFNWSNGDTITNQPTVINGIFNVRIGSLNPSGDPLNINFNQDTWLGVTVEADSEMIPRRKIASVPSAHTADQLDNIDSASFLRSDTSDSFTSGTLTFDSGTTLDINSTTVSIADTDITLDGASTTFTSTGVITFQAAGTGTTSRVQIGAGGSGSTTPDFFALDVKSDTGDPAGGANGYMYYNAADLKFRCYENGTWKNCITTAGGGGLWEDGTTFIYPTDITDDLVVGASTVAGASLYFDESAGILYLGTNESLNGQITLYSSGATITDPTISADASGNLTLSAGQSSASVIVGDGSGNIKVNLSNEGDLLLADKSVTLTGAYTSTDYSFDRSFTGGVNSQGGKVFSITDTSTGSGTVNPDMLFVNWNVTGGASFTGNLLRLQKSSADVFVVDSNGTLTLTGATTDITSATNENLTLTAGGTGDVVVTTDSDTPFIIGTTSNGFTFDSTSGPTYAGTARPTKKVTLVPEYSGATIDEDGVSNTGTMTSGFCSTPRSYNAAITPTNDSPCDSDVSGEEHNYYTWTTDQGTAQDYDIWVRWQVPSDFSGFDTLTGAIQAYGWRTDSTTNQVQISLYDTSGTADATDVNVATSTSPPAWTQTTIDSTPSGTYTTGSYATFRIHMIADQNDHVKVGEITINYKAKF